MSVFLSMKIVLSVLIGRAIFLVSSSLFRNAQSDKQIFNKQSFPILWFLIITVWRYINMTVYFFAFILLNPISQRDFEKFGLPSNLSRFLLVCPFKKLHCHIRENLIKLPPWLKLWKSEVAVQSKQPAISIMKSSNRERIMERNRRKLMAHVISHSVSHEF